MSSTKRLKHISMMLLWDDVTYIEENLCQSHGDLSHIFRNVFHNFVEQLRAGKREAEKKKKVETKKERKIEDDTNTDNPPKAKTSKSNRPKNRKDSVSGGSARKGRK